MSGLTKLNIMYLLRITLILYIIVITFKKCYSQNIDTLVIKKAKCIILTTPYKNYLDSLKKQNLSYVKQMELGYAAHIQPIIDSATRYNIPIIHSDTRFILFPIETKTSTGFSETLLIDRKALAEKGAASSEVTDQRLWGVFWYGGRNDEIHWGFKHPFRMSMKKYFFRD